MTAMSTDKGKTLRSVADDAIQRFEMFLPDLHVADSGEARIGTTLLLTLGEQFHAMLQLMDNDCETHAAGPIRSMIEGLVDLMILSKDSSYLEQLAFDNSKSDASTLGRYLEELSDSPDSDMISELRTLLDMALAKRNQHKATGAKIQTRKDKFALAGLPDLPAAYGVLSSLIHPNLTALMSRHVGDKFELNYRAKPASEIITMLLSMGIRVLTQAIGLLPRFTDVNPEKVCEAVSELEHAHMRANGIS